MAAFLKMLGQIVSYVFLAVAFWLYLQYSNELEELTVIAMLVGVGVAVSGGMTFSLASYRQAAVRTEEEGTEERRVVWSPLAELYYDLLGWAVFLTIIVLAVVLSAGFDSADLVQAAVGLVAFTLGKRLFVRRIVA